MHREPQGVGDSLWWCEPGGWARCSFGQPGDRLWVRETWADYTHNIVSNNGVGIASTTRPIYRADDDSSLYDVRWKPSIHMPRWASRITLEVTEVRVERVQEITEDDVLAEGITHEFYMTEAARIGEYRDLWNHLNAKRGYGWDANPWVWVIRFGPLQPKASVTQP